VPVTGSVIIYSPVFSMFTAEHTCPTACAYLSTQEKLKWAK